LSLELTKLSHKTLVITPDNAVMAWRMRQK